MYPRKFENVISSRSLTSALERCDQVFGKLFAIEDCAELESVNTALKSRGYADGEEFFLGAFKHGLLKATERRRSAPADTEINS